MALNTTAADFLVKKLYPDGLDEDCLVRDKPLLQWCENETDFASHKGIDIPAPYVNPQGLGSTNAIAAANEASSNGFMFTVPQRHLYQFARLNGDVVRNTLAGGDAAQFTNILTREVDGATESIGSELNQRMYGASDGIRAYVHPTTAPATTTLTLANPEDAQFFEPGMKVSAVDGAGALRNAGAAVLLTKVDPIAGTLTASTNWTTTIAALAVGDGLIREGQLGADLDGLRGWVPTTVSGADSFLGVNRSTYRTRLAGVYADVSNYPIRSGLLRAFAIAKQQVGARFQSKSPIFINPSNFMAIVQSVEGVKITDIKLDDKYGIGLEAVEVLGYKFVQDSHCPVNEAFLVGDGAFTRGSAGKQPHIDDQDGNRFFFNRSTGQLDFSIVHDGNTYSRNPGLLMRIKLPAVL